MTKNAQPIFDQELSVPEAARILTVSRYTIYRYIREGVLSSRDVALPSSNRHCYRLLLVEVQNLKASRQRLGWRRPEKQLRQSTVQYSLNSLHRLRVRPPN